MKQLIEASAKMLRLCITDDPPIAFCIDQHSTVIYSRILELQAEQCDAIYILCDEGLYRPAHSILRSILENMATLIWVSLDTERYGKLFDEGKQPNTREILKRIGWEQEYDRTFKPLSSFVHADLSNAEMYKNYDFGEGGLCPEVEPDAEYYIIETPNGYLPLGVKSMSQEEAKTLYEPFLAIKVFDLTIAGLERLHGAESPNLDWWPDETIPIFINACAKDKKLSELMLWSIQKRLFE